MQGRFFALENLPGISKYHFNLYGIDREGDEVLMTVDHIVPRAHGGASSLENYQTFCKVCNERKGDRIPNEPVMNRFFYPSADELHVIKASLKNRGYSRELQSLEARDIGLGYAYRDGRTKAFIVIENTLFEGVGRNKLSAVSESFTRPPYTF